MQDVSPELLNRIRSDFREACRADKELGKTIDRIDGGKGTYREAQEFASNIGDKLGEAYKKNLTPESLPDGRLYRNIAEKVIRPTLHENYELVSDASQKVQKALNDEAGIGLKVQIPEEDTDRVDGIIDRVSDHVDEFTSETADDLAGMTENFTHHVVDAFIEKNADFQYNAGLKPKIERDAMAECCGWCLDLAGTYEYPLKDRSVFQRHKDCRCVVDYHPGNGKVQNAHTKQWRDETDSDILEVRKTANLEPLVDPAKVEQRKKGSEYMDYKPVIRSDVKNLNVDTGNNEVIKARAVVNRDSVYISDLANIKPRRLHDICNEVEKALVEISSRDSKGIKPVLLIVGDTELGNSGGRYDAINNILLLKPLAEIEKQLHVIRHELFHWSDYQDYLKKNKPVNSDAEFIEIMCKRCKKKLDKLGITIDNVGEISSYALYSMLQGRYDEVYTEYRTVRIERKEA